MPQSCWRATGNGSYWIDVALGNIDLRVMVDSGLVDPYNRVGFELEPNAYDQLKQSKCLSFCRPRTRRDASGAISLTEIGKVSSQLLCSITRQRVGPAVQLFVSRGSPGVPSRVGLAFFHHLGGCQVLWDLDTRTWCINYP